VSAALWAGPSFQRVERAHARGIGRIEALDEHPRKFPHSARIFS
jgi:hypothetical protein